MKTEFLDMQALDGQRVRVYRNLDYRPDRVYSVLIYLKGIGWRLKGHSDNILLEDVAFIVGEDVRIKVIARKRKLVHAYASGRVAGLIHPEASLIGEEATYDPYIAPTFHVVSTGGTLYKADYCQLDSEGLRVYR